MDDHRRRATALRALARQSPGRFHGLRHSPAWVEALGAFGSEQALVLAVHQRWQVGLLARLDQVLERGPDDPHVGVRRSVEELSRDLPGFAAIVGEAADDPAVIR